VTLRLLPVLLALAVAGCATAAAIQWAPESAFTLTTTDNPAQQRFDLVFSSKSDKPLCLSKEAWPAEAGLPPGFDGAVLTTSEGSKQLLPTGSAYCPGGCGEVRVEPGQQVQGAIGYAAFGDAASIAVDTTRSLAFAVHPYVCTR